MLNAQELLKSLRHEEIVMILALRNKFKFGTVNILMRDGVPQRVEKVVVFVDLKEKNQEVVKSMID